ncbi:MAG: urea ABC transporter ATP-binding subunit UrtE [Pseudomonadota bacterium]
MSLSVELINQHYGSSHTLRDISFTAADAECVAVLGRNGAGKTTLLKCLMGLLPATSGAVVYRGQTLTDAPSHHRARAGIGYVPQGREVFAGLSVGENLEFAANAAGHGDENAVIDEMIELFPVLGEMWRRRGGDLSGGQQQQLSIARALATRPSLLVLDEPTEGVQPSIVKRIEEVIVALKGRMSILLVEQYFDFARSIADGYLVLQRGEVAASGRMAEMDVDRVRKLLAV